MKKFEYKGFTGSAEVSIEDNCLFGVLENINGLVTYEAKTIEELEKEFKLSVESYLETCEKFQIEPNKAKEESAEIGTDFFEKARLQAKKLNKTLNGYLNDILQKDIEASL
jgi:predicted HicB family RNase H-like nuclease